MLIRGIETGKGPETAAELEAPHELNLKINTSQQESFEFRRKNDIKTGCGKDATWRPQISYILTHFGNIKLTKTAVCNGVYFLLFLFYRILECLPLAHFLYRQFLK